MAYEAMEFPKKLEWLIEYRNTSQTEVGMKAGLVQSAVSEMISVPKGKKKLRRPYLDQAFRLARALRVSLDYLANDELDGIPDEQMTDVERKVWEFIQTIGPENAFVVLSHAVQEMLRRDQEKSPAREGSGKAHAVVELKPRKESASKKPKSGRSGNNK